MPQTHPAQVPVNYGRFLGMKVLESLRDIQDLSMSLKLVNGLDTHGSALMTRRKRSSNDEFSLVT